MKTVLLRFAANESGATAIEYGMLASLVGCGIIVAATTLGTDISTFFTTVGTKLAGTVVP
ncbi:Flp family type IVb pilin [Kaistia algarum]|jgi:pilus assembly protein Flp/PilA|uniref:Flp family type IVb pilin n=1 Tax=Kaistia algarum TaxID=2083279 RepID=UPI000CE7C33A|nr:Flp family type IVb pilin [Kaistia algarum]MCX5516654.1 Flp family type IVb pilin [Kaistia algarum]PPE77257.1 Flp family type IVb pilin [Kaistia algarum]